MRLAPQECRTYFVTFVTAGRRRLFQVESNAVLLMHVIAAQRRQGRMWIHAFVVMPDHAHLLLTPAPEISLEKAVQFIKGRFSFRLKSNRDVWERGYNETRVVDGDAFGACRTYIHTNPVRKGLATGPEDFPFSSASLTDCVDAPPAWVTRVDG